jgi:hypothetical protein
MTPSPYVIGGALGLLNTFAFATAKRGLGVTKAFESAAALAGRQVAPDVMNVNAAAFVPLIDAGGDLGKRTLPSLAATASARLAATKAGASEGSPLYRESS